MTSRCSKADVAGQSGCEAGYTLVELLVVLAVIALATGLAAVNWQQSARHPNLDQAAARVTATLWASRSLAIRTGGERRVFIDVRNNSVEPPAPLKVVQLPQAISLELTAAHNRDAEDGKAVIVFFSDGSSTGGEIVLRSGLRSVSIRIDWLTGSAGLRNGS